MQLIAYRVFSFDHYLHASQLATCCNSIQNRRIGTSRTKYCTDMFPVQPQIYWTRTSRPFGFLNSNEDYLQAPICRKYSTYPACMVGKAMRTAESFSRHDSSNHVCNQSGKAGDAMLYDSRNCSALKTNHTRAAAGVWERKLGTARMRGRSPVDARSPKRRNEGVV